MGCTGLIQNVLHIPCLGMEGHLAVALLHHGLEGAHKHAVRERVPKRLRVVSP